MSTQITANVFLQPQRGPISSSYTAHGIISIPITGSIVREALASHTLLILLSPLLVCEYYLSRHRLVDSDIPDNSSVVIISDEIGFTVGVTEMTLFFMMLSFTQGILSLSLCLESDPMTREPSGGVGV